MRKDTDGINGEDKEGNLEVDLGQPQAGSKTVTKWRITLHWTNAETYPALTGSEILPPVSIKV